jgi:hypothetical protein
MMGMHTHQEDEADHGATPQDDLPHIICFFVHLSFLAALLAELAAIIHCLGDFATVAAAFF